MPMQTKLYKPIRLKNEKWNSVNYRYAPASRTMLSFPNVVTKDSRRYVVEELEADGSRCSRRRHRCRRCSRLW